MANIYFAFYIKNAPQNPELKIHVCTLHDHVIDISIQRHVINGKNKNDTTIILLKSHLNDPGKSLFILL